MSTLIRHRSVLADDTLLLADDSPLPASGRALVSLQRWQAQSAALAEAAVPVGVVLPNTADVLALWPQLAQRPVLALDFPAFADGRAYSQASLLRGRCRYQGELLAMGKAVVRDQLAGMERCGFDSFLLREDQDPQTCLKAFDDLPEVYQVGADGRIPVYRRRRMTAA